MDPVTQALINGIASGTASSLTTEALKKLKHLLVTKFGPDSSILRAMRSLEEQPESTNRRGVLEEEVKISQADADAEILAAAKTLLAQVAKQQPKTRVNQATLKGSGAIGQGEKVTVAGKGGIAVGGDVEGGIVMSRGTRDT